MASAWILSISGSAPSSAIFQWRFSGRFFTAARWCGSCLAAFSLAEGKKLFKKDLAKAANLCYDGKKEAMCHEMSLLRLGYIQNRDGVYWTEKKRKVAALLAGGGNTIQLGDLTSTPFCMGETEAWNCQACKTIIIPYEEGKGNETELV